MLSVSIGERGNTVVIKADVISGYINTGIFLSNKKCQFSASHSSIFGGHDMVDNSVLFPELHCQKNSDERQCTEENDQDEKCFDNQVPKEEQKEWMMFSLRQDLEDGSGEYKTTIYTYSNSCIALTLSTSFQTALQ